MVRAELGSYALPGFNCRYKIAAEVQGGFGSKKEPNCRFVQKSLMPLFV